MVNEKIYLELDYTPTTIRELLLSLYSFCYNYPDKIIPSIDWFTKQNIVSTYEFTSVETYFDEECFLLQCKERTYRSYYDICDLVNTYFPNTKEEEIIKNIICLDPNLKPYFFNCTDIIKPTVTYYSVGNEFVDTSWPSRHDLEFNGGKQWQDIFEKVGITNYKQLEKYIIDNRNHNEDKKV